MDIVQAVVFMLIGVITASLVYRVLKDMTYQQNRRAIEDDRKAQLKKAMETKTNEPVK